MFNPEQKQPQQQQQQQKKPNVLTRLLYALPEVREDQERQARERQQSEINQLNIDTAKDSAGDLDQQRKLRMFETIGKVVGDRDINGIRDNYSKIIGTIQKLGMRLEDDDFSPTDENIMHLNNAAEYVRFEKNPESRGVIDQKLRAEGLTPGTPEYNQRARALNDKTRGNSVTINTGDNIPLNKPVQNDAQKSIISSTESLKRMDRIKANYDPSFLTYEGKIKNFASGMKSKLGGKLSPEQSKSIRQYRRFSQSVNREFNAYRKEITGAAAAVAELESLKKATINTDLSPEEFEAAFGEYIRELQRTIRLKNRLLRQGIGPNDKEFGKSLDDLYLSNDDDEIEARGDELEAQGMGPEQIAETLEDEGYF